MTRRYRPATYSKAPPPQPFRGYNRPAPGQTRSPPEFWAWFDGLPREDRELLDHTPFSQFRDVMEQIAIRQLERQWDT